MEVTQHNFTHLVSEEENKVINTVIQTFESPLYQKHMTRQERQYEFMKKLQQLYPNNSHIVFEIYTNANTSFQ